MKLVGYLHIFKRGFLQGTLLTLISLALVLPSYAADKLRIAVVISASIKPYKEALTGFYDELNSTGIDYETREFLLGNGNGDSFIVDKVREYDPAVIHTVGSKATKLVKKNFDKRPVIFSMVLNPVASGFVDSMKKPGSNITGASMDIPFSEQFKYMRSIAPKTKRIGIIYSEAETGSVVREAEKVARQLGFKFIKIEVKSPADLYGALKELVGKVDFLWSVADGNVFTRETTREILIATLREGLPFMGLSPGFVRAGALAALESSPHDMGREAAKLTKIIINGKRPADIPVTMANNVRLYLNSNTIDVIDINIPKDVYGSAVLIKP